MKMNFKIAGIIILVVFVIYFVFSWLFPENARVKSFGGDMTIDLPVNQKLVTITWKENEVWYLTRPMRQDEFPETSTFQQKSTYGVFEGTIHIQEHK